MAEPITPDAPLPQQQPPVSPEQMSHYHHRYHNRRRYYGRLMFHLLRCVLLVAIRYQKTQQRKNLLLYPKQWQVKPRKYFPTRPSQNPPKVQKRFFFSFLIYHNNLYDYSIRHNINILNKTGFFVQGMI